MSERTVSIIISGRVQGVWFRASTKQEADVRGLRGYVKNLPDGNVYIVASGDASHIETFIQWCHKGPELARVDSVSVTDIPVEHFVSFELRRS